MGVGDFTAWCAARQWQLLASASIPGAAGSEAHLSAGVAIAARQGLGLRRPREGTSPSHVVVPARLVAGVLDLPGGASLLVGGAYFHAGQALSSANRIILSRWADTVRCFSPEGSHLLGADFNVPLTY